MSNNSHNILTGFHEPLVSGFLKSVKAFPDRNALWINERYYTYKELWQRVYSIYQQIPDDTMYERIGIYCNDDVNTYAGVLAISLYGAAYVPLNNKFPTARNKNYVEQCELKLVLTSVEKDELKEIIPDENIVVTDYLEQVFPKPDLIALQKTHQPTAYILFTSGSTGEPKGVPVSHSNANHFFDFFYKNYDFSTDDKFLQVYELTFDVSVFSFFMPLYIGACCYAVPNEGIKFVKIIQLLERHKITVVSMVPSVLNFIEKYLAELKLPHIRYSFFSGDALYHHLAVAWSNALPVAVLHNFYGPTETTIVCTRYVWDKFLSEKESVNGIVPLGKPFEHMEIIIVDENHQPTSKGELCFSGTQVISDYLNGVKEGQFFKYKNKRYYKTGDIVSMNEYGNLVFHGRLDGQLKINGYRVETGEIEAAIHKITNTKSMIVFNNEKLFAFVEQTLLDEADIKEKLTLLLPGYMIPHRIMHVRGFPLTINGKVDKQKLVGLTEQVW